MKLTIVVPMYNEERFIRKMLDALIVALQDHEWEIEILVVDDGSTDLSCMEVRSIQSSRIRLLEMPTNSGKGAAVRFGISHASGDLVIVQDADLEYDPRDIPKMLKIYEKYDYQTCAVYGSRILGAKTYLSGWRSRIGLWHGQGLPQRGFNLSLSLFYLLLTRKWISDLLTGYKIYPRWVFNDWQSSTSGFETDHEITMRLEHIGIRIYEIPVSYLPRSKEMGKKSKSSDAIKAVSTLWKYRK